MKKKYINPSIQAIKMESQTILASSKPNKPGHGWGDDNHDHWKDDEEDNQNNSFNTWEL